MNLGPKSPRLPIYPAGLKRVLMVSPHFPPDSSAGAHRVRLLAPHLPSFGWQPTVVSVDPLDYECRLDWELAGLVPDDLRVIRCRIWRPEWTRRFGVGDLGLRSLQGLWQTCSRLLAAEPFDALYITIYPSYPALLGPRLKRRFRVPFVLDYQDPWVGAWGESVGGGRAGRPDLKSQVTRAIAEFFEPRVLRWADAATAVSAATLSAVWDRNPRLKRIPSAEIPIGGEAGDFDRLKASPRKNHYFDPDDGLFHLCYVGTLLPLGFETLRAVLGAVGALREQRPDLALRLRLHFFGTSNETRADAPQRVVPVAKELGVADLVSEVASRIDYLDALTVQTQATGLLLMGSSETHYTASKLYPSLLARRPTFAVYHEASTVVSILRKSARAPSVRLVVYNDAIRAENRTSALVKELAELIASPVYNVQDFDDKSLEAYSARSLADKLADVFNRVCVSK
jgi:hypothetical protein